MLKEKRVDVCWYCVSNSQSRLEQVEVELIEIDSTHYGNKK